MKIRSFLYAALAGTMFFCGAAQAEYAVVTLDAKDASGLMAKAKDAAKTNKVNVCIAVVGPTGVLISFERMDHAPASCVDIAIAKARAAALYRVKTSVNMQRVNGDEPAIAYMPNMMPITGGVPVVNDDVVVGAVGVSGATNQIDTKIAESMVAGYGVVKEK